MFKPHKGICSCHQQERWIINKKGECSYGQKERTAKLRDTRHNHIGRNDGGPENDNSKKAKVNRPIDNDGSGGNGKVQKRSSILRKKVLSYNRPKRKEATDDRHNFNVRFQNIRTITPSSSVVLQKRKPIKKVSEKKLQRNRDGLSEATFFKEIFEEALEKKYPECPKCQCCGSPLGFEARTFFFSHVLAKSTFGLFRLWTVNIWLCCLQCHSEWDQGDRSQTKFAAKRFFAAKLKRFYYEIKDLIEEDRIDEMKLFELENK